MAKSIDETLVRVKSSIENDNFDTALELLNSIGNTSNVLSHYYYCIVAKKTNQKPETILRHAQRGLQLSDDFEPLQHYKYYALKRMEQWNDAAAQGMMLSNKDPENYAFRFEVAELLGKTGNRSEASIFRSLGHLAAARVYIQHGEQSKALAELISALKHDQNNVKAILLLVDCLTALDREEDAKEVIIQNLDRESIKIDLLTHLCELELQDENHHESISICKQLIDIKPEYTYPYRVLCKLAEIQGQLPLALDNMDALTDVADDDIWCHLSRHSCAHQLCNEANFLNAQSNPAKFWQITHALFDSGVEDYAYRKIREYKPIDRHFKQQLLTFGNKVFASGEHTALDALLNNFPLDTWRHAELQFLFGKNLFYAQGFDAAASYLESLIKHYGETQQLMFQLAQATITHQLHTCVTPLNQPTLQRFTAVIEAQLASCPEDSTANYVFAGLLAYNDEWHQAEKYFCKARSIGLAHTCSVYSAFWIAAARYAQGKFDTAMTIFIEGFETRLHGASPTQMHLALKEKIRQHTQQALW